MFIEHEHLEIWIHPIIIPYIFLLLYSEKRVVCFLLSYTLWSNTRWAQTVEQSYQLLENVHITSHVIQLLKSTKGMTYPHLGTSITGHLQFMQNEQYSLPSAFFYYIPSLESQYVVTIYTYLEDHGRSLSFLHPLWWDGYLWSSLYFTLSTRVTWASWISHIARGTSADNRLRYNSNQFILVYHRLIWGAEPQESITSRQTVLMPLTESYCLNWELTTFNKGVKF